MEVETTKKHDSFGNRLGKKLAGKLGIGIITIVPAVATAWILYHIFIFIDDFLQPFIRLAVGHTIPGAGFAISVVLIFIIGVIASNVIGKRLIQYAESILPGMPIVRQLYNAIKQFMESFNPSKDNPRMQPVFVDFPRKGMKALGFLTSELRDDSGKNMLTIFIPHTPNPTSGFMVIVEESEVVRTNISLENALKMVVSAGKVVPNTASIFPGAPTA